MLYYNQKERDNQMTDNRVFSIQKWAKMCMLEAKAVATKKALKKFIADLEDDLTQPQERIFQLRVQGMTREAMTNDGYDWAIGWHIDPAQFKPMTEEEYKAMVKNEMLPALYKKLESLK